MKSTCQFLFTLSALLIAFSASAQFSLGARGGVYWAGVRQTETLDNLTPDLEDITSFQVAAVGEYAFTDAFSLQSELAFTRKGFGYRQGVDVDLFNLPLPLGVRAEARFDYVDLPLLAKVKFGGQQFKGYLLAGPQLGYALSGQLVTRADGLLDMKLTDTDIDLDAINYERLEIAGTVGAGVSYDAGFGTFFVDARYQHGFTELYDIPLVDEHIRNRGFGLSAGFSLPLGGSRPLP